MRFRLFLAIAAATVLTLTAAPATAQAADTPLIKIVIDPESTNDNPVAITDHGEHGHTYTPDYDGYVPTSYGGDCNDGVLAYASWYSEGDWYIVYDKCEMDRHGAGQNDWDAVGRHEKAHTEGWGHYEAPADRNAAFEPGIVICGC